jgi:putative DNA methylase
LTAHPEASAASNLASLEPRPATGDPASRLIDTWFPCVEVDAAVRTPAGSGRSEKALFTWFASRPIAQARAAVLCSLLPDTATNRDDIRIAISAGDEATMARLRARIAAQYGNKSPFLLDMFSGRGIIPLEAVRSGASAIGTDLSPVATLAGRLLADYPLKDWSAEPALPYIPGYDIGEDEEGIEGTDTESPRRIYHVAQTLDSLLEISDEPRLLRDVRTVLAEVGRRVASQLASLYPGNPDRGDQIPWAYLWAITIPCDGCRRQFPLLGSMVLRHPYKRTGDDGQALKLICEGDVWRAIIQTGVPLQAPTFTAPEGRRGKSARCPFPGCAHVHTLDVVKAKGNAGQYVDAMIAVGETDADSKQKRFREPRPDEVLAAGQAAVDTIRPFSVLSPYPGEAIPKTAGVDASQYGFSTYGSLMNARQTLLFSTTAKMIDELYRDLRGVVSEEYAGVLAAYAAANLPRQLRRSTRGANLLSHGNKEGTKQNRCQVGDVYSKQSVMKFQFDYLEAGPGNGPGTWTSVSASLVNALRKILAENRNGSRPARFRRSSATSLPFRDSTVDVIVCDPPYYQMIAYADSSDLSYVWLKRALSSAMPDLFDGRNDGRDGLQDKAEEIVVKGRGAKGHGDHRTEEFYEAMLLQAFLEAKRVLRPMGHLTVIFGHADPEAWKRLLTALTDAGFVVTSSWPSRTETAATGVATISVTVTIGARVAATGRPVGIAAQVDAEVVAEVKTRCRAWDLDGLALEDQLMASYGAALQVLGRYTKVITPSGRAVSLEHYMTLARRAVRDAVAFRLDEVPLEDFDPGTRLAIFWHEVHGRVDVPKGEARFFAQSDGLRLEDLRGPILAETKAGFQLRHDGPGQITSSSSVYEVVRGMAAAWSAGTEAAAACLAAAERQPLDPQVWAVVDWLATKLPISDPVSVALAAITRNRASIQASAAAQSSIAASGTLF